MKSNAMIFFKALFQEQTAYISTFKDTAPN